MSNIEISYFEDCDTDQNTQNSYVTNAAETDYVSQYPTQDADHVKATSSVGDELPHMTTDPANSLTGTPYLTSWYTNNLTNQRFHIDLGSAKIVTRFYYENMHNAGASTDRGVQNFTLWGSNTAGSFAELTYGTDTGWTQLTTGQSTFDQHVAADQADPKYITVTNTTAYRYYAFKFADNYGNVSYFGVRRIELQTNVYSLQSYSEATIKTQGSYALKAVAAIDESTSIINEDMSDITDWTDADTGSGVSSQATFDSKSCMKLDSGASTGGGNSGYRQRDIGSFGARTVISFNLYADNIGSMAQYDSFDVTFFNGTKSVVLSFATDGLFIYVSSYTEIGTDLVTLDTWQEWTFDINWTAGTMDVYLDKVLKASGVGIRTAAGTEGMIYLQCVGYTVGNRIVYIDWFTAGAGLLTSLNKTLTHTFASNQNLTGVNTLKFDMQSTRTGANVKLGLHDTGGTTTELTPTINSADTYETKTWDISEVADADKNAIDTLTFTQVNADNATTWYVDNFYGFSGFPRSFGVIIM